MHDFPSSGTKKNMYEGAGVSYWYWGAVVCAKEKNIHLGEITPALSLVGKVKSLSLLAEGNQTPYVQRSQRFQEQMVPFCMKCLMMCANEAGVSAVLGHRGPLQDPGTLIFFYLFIFFLTELSECKEIKELLLCLKGNSLHPGCQMSMYMLINSKCIFRKKIV